jgi:nucleotide-binding universal stress UspA family protein
MSTAQDARAFRRILVALDASKESLAALDAAADLAARLEAELVGLFVEDADLLNLAGLPFAREVTTLSPSPRVMDAKRLAEDLRAKAAVARQAIARTAEALHVQWSFRTARGRVDAEILAAAQDADLIAVGKSARPLTGAPRIGRNTRAIAVQTTRSLLFASTPTCGTDAPVATIYDGSAAASEALALAGRIAEREGKRLTVFVIGDSAAALAQNEIAAREQITALGASAMIRRVRGGPEEVVRQVRAAAPALLVAGMPTLGGEESVALDLIVEKSACSVLLLR